MARPARQFAPVLPLPVCREAEAYRALGRHLALAIRDCEMLADLAEAREQQAGAGAVVQQPEWLSVSAAARAWGVSRSVVYRALALGELEAATLAGVRRVRRVPKESA